MVCLQRNHLFYYVNTSIPLAMPVTPDDHLISRLLSFLTRITPGSGARAGRLVACLWRMDSLRSHSGLPRHQPYHECRHRKHHPQPCASESAEAYMPVCLLPDSPKTLQKADTYAGSMRPLRRGCTCSMYEILCRAFMIICSHFSALILHVCLCLERTSRPLGMSFNACPSPCRRVDWNSAFPTLTPATEPTLELRYKPEPAIAMSASSTPAPRPMNVAEWATPVASPTGRISKEAKKPVLPRHTTTRLANAATENKEPTI